MEGRGRSKKRDRGSGKTMHRGKEEGGTERKLQAEMEERKKERKVGRGRRNRIQNGGTEMKTQRMGGKKTG